jgi:flagellar hook assembly protein FlgD
MFSVPESGPVSMVVYDILGREVTTLIAGRIMSPGVQSVTWDGLDAKGNPVPGGIYFYRMTAGDFVKTQKMLLLK